MKLILMAVGAWIFISTILSPLLGSLAGFNWRGEE